MCFVIAGVQPKTRTADTTPRRCPRCGLHQAYLQQVDHYLSLFFIPLLRVKQGNPFLYCRRCQLPVQGTNDPHGDDPLGGTPALCRRCGRSLQSDYTYCPNCGLKL